MLVRILQRAFRRRRAASSEPSDPKSIAGSEAPAADSVSTAIAHAQRGELTDAERLLKEALAFDGTQAAAHDALGNVLRAQDRLEDALASYQRALRLDPLRVSAHSNIALCLRDLGRYEEAHGHLERALDLDRADPRIATNLAALLFDVGRFEEASARIESVLQRYPNFAEARVVRGTRRLRRAAFDQGWIDYEWRDRNAGREGPAAFDYPEWDGNPIAPGHLLVCCEQGLGDQIMFASCIDDLLRIAPDCLVECDARLKALFARSFPQARFYVMRKRAEEMWLRDGCVPIAKTWMGSLPGRFRRQLADFPSRAGYLRADLAKVDAWRRELQSLGPGPKIGISWRGGVASTRRSLRSIALEEWVPLLRSSGRHFISLQYGDCEREIEQVRSADMALTHWPDAIRDLDQAAALVSALDLVISVQTTVVHLAGALGKPVWVLVPSVAEWRYGERGERMPWYPSARLFRQQRTSGWREVLERARRATDTLS